MSSLNLAGRGREREIKIKQALEEFVNSMIDTSIITLCGPNSHLESDPGSSTSVCVRVCASVCVFWYMLHSEDQNTEWCSTLQRSVSGLPQSWF